MERPQLSSRLLTSSGMCTPETSSPGTVSIVGGQQGAGAMEGAEHGGTNRPNHGCQTKRARYALLAKQETSSATSVSGSNGQHPLHRSEENKRRAECKSSGGNGESESDIDVGEPGGSHDGPLQGSGVPNAKRVGDPTRVGEGTQECLIPNAIGFDSELRGEGFCAPINHRPESEVGGGGGDRVPTEVLDSTTPEPPSTVESPDPAHYRP